MKSSKSEKGRPFTDRLGKVVAALFLVVLPVSLVALFIAMKLGVSMEIIGTICLYGLVPLAIVILVGAYVYAALDKWNKRH